MIKREQKHLDPGGSCPKADYVTRPHPAMDDNYQNEDYQNEGYHSDEYQNDTASEISSHTWEVHSTSEQQEKEPVTLDQGCENAVEQEYEYIPFSGMWMRTQPEEEPNPVLYIFEDDTWRFFPRKTFIIFCIVLFSSLTMTTAALVMACLKCSPVCPDGWDEFQEKCYYTSEKGNIQEKSRNICQSKGADLMVIDHAKKQDFLVKKMKDKRNVWIGLKYEASENVWRWINGKNLSYQNWQAGAPRKEQQEFNAECVIAEHEHNYQWIKYYCRRNIPSPICEKNRHVDCVLQSPFQPL